MGGHRRFGAARPRKTWCSRRRTFRTFQERTASSRFSCRSCSARRVPSPPQYVCHPKTHDPEIARNFGAAPGKTEQLSWGERRSSPQGCWRATSCATASRSAGNDAGFRNRLYRRGGAPPGTYRKDLVQLPRGNAVRAYARRSRGGFLVLEGRHTVGGKRTAT